MANTLQAGAVAVEFLAQDAKFMASLQKIEKSVSGFAANLRNNLLTAGLGVGALRTAFSATIAPVVSLATEFAKAGDEVGKMSKRVGIGAHDLSLLGHAAELSGSSLADLGNSMKFFHKNLAAAGEYYTVNFNAKRDRDRTIRVPSVGSKCLRKAVPKN